MMSRRWKGKGGKVYWRTAWGGGGHVGKISLGPFCHFYPSPAAPDSKNFSPR